MQQQNSNFLTLTKNEQKVLKKIIDKAKTPDLEIAKDLRLSQQAIFRIRHKLEEAGIIKGYAPIIDFKKIGIETLVVLGLKFTQYTWGKYSEEQLARRIQLIPEVLTAYRIPESRISHVLVMGFRNTESKDRYLMKLQSKHAKEIEIVHVYPFSVDRIIKMNHMGLLTMIIDHHLPSSGKFFLDN